MTSWYLHNDFSYCTGPSQCCPGEELLRCNKIQLMSERSLTSLNVLHVRTMALTFHKLHWLPVV